MKCQKNKCTNSRYAGPTKTMQGLCRQHFLKQKQDKETDKRATKTAHEIMITQHLEALIHNKIVKRVHLENAIVRLEVATEKLDKQMKATAEAWSWVDTNIPNYKE